MKTGWPPGLLQDDDKGLSKWLAGRPDARYQVRKNIMTTQTEAQRLADALTWRVRVFDGVPILDKAAAELRRLDAAAMECGSGAGCCYQSAKIEALEAQVERMRKEGIRLHEVELTLKAANAELLEALRHIHGVALADDYRDLPGIAQTSGDAIKKHGGEA